MIRYELRQGKDGTGTLQVRIVAKGVNTKVTTGVRIKAREWSAEAQTLKHSTDKRQVPSLGGVSYAELSGLLAELRHALEVLDGRGEATAGKVKELITDILRQGMCRKTVDTGKGCFVEFLGQYIEEMKDGTRTKKRTHEKVRDYYVKQFGQLKAKLEKYQEEEKADIGWGSLTKTFLGKFCVFLAGLGLKYNSVGTYVKLLATVVREAQRRRLVTCDTDIEEWRMQPELTDKVALTEEKLGTLYAMDLTDDKQVERLIAAARQEDKEWVKWKLKSACNRKSLQNVANAFLLCCLTGQRYSDHGRMTKESVCMLDDGRRYIFIKQQKTGKELYIPLDCRAEAVMGRNVRVVDCVTMNSRIKEIGRILGWTETTGFTEVRNGMKYLSQRPFYEYLQSHTARRTFATLAYKRGASLEAIMAVTGHSSEAMLKRYIRVDEKEKAMMASRELFRVQAVRLG